MAKLTKGYYHCLECGALFQADVKTPADQRCSVCGAPPTGRSFSIPEKEEPLPKPPPQESVSSTVLPRVSDTFHGINHDSQDIYEATVATLDAQIESRTGRVKRSKRKAKKGKMKKVLIGSWFVVMIAVVVLVKSLSSEEEEESSTQTVRSESEQRALLAERQQKDIFIREALPHCQETMKAFRDASSPEAKAQYVYQGEKLVGVMSRYYKNDIGFTAGSGNFEMVRAELLHGFKLKTVGVLFSNESGETWEAVFVLVGKDWKIDWKMLVRYDDRSWSVFPAGEDGDVGEFRLYMRVRDTNADFEQKEMSLVFYKPSMFFKGEFRGLASKPVSVMIESKLGRQITELLKQEKQRMSGEKDDREDAHGLSLAGVDPERFHRVRVQMKLHKVGKNQHRSELELLKILATDWYGIESEDFEEPEDADR